MGNASGSDGGGIGSDRSSGVASRSGARGAIAGNNQRGGFSGGAMGTPGSDRGGIRGNEGNTGRNSAMGGSAPSRSVSVTPASRPPAATVTVAPPPAPVVAAPPAAVPSAPISAPAAPVSMAPQAYGPSAIGSAPMSAAQVGQIAATNAATASPNTSMGPMSQRGTVSSSGYGAVSATPSAPSRSASPATRGGLADAARAVGAREAGLPSVNSAAKGDFGAPSMGGISGGRANAGGLGGMGNAANVGVSSNVAGKSDRGVPSINSRSDMAGLIAGQRFGGQQPSSQRSSPMGISNLSDAQISNTIGAMVGLPGASFTGLSPTGSFASNSPSAASIARSEGLMGLPASASFSSPTMTATPTAKAITDRISATPAMAGLAPPANSRTVQDAFKDVMPSERQMNRMSNISENPNFDNTPLGSTIPGVQATPTSSTNDFYSSDNSYTGVSFPSVVDAYPGVFGSATGSLPGGYSTRPEGAWTSTAQSFSNPMDAARSMSPMDQMRSYGMFTRGGTPPPSRGEPGGRDTPTRSRQSTAKRIAEALKQETRKSGWSPYTGSSRFANWSPIQKALMGV